MKKIMLELVLNMDCLPCTRINKIMLKLVLNMDCLQCYKRNNVETGVKQALFAMI